MILIVGTNKDDVLYFSSILKDKRTEMVFDRYELEIGTIFNQEILIIKEQYTSLLAASVITNILDNHYVDLVINVGRCVSLDGRLKPGDIVISGRIIDVNVDMTTYKNVKVAQIPSFNRDFTVQSDIIDYLRAGLTKRTYANAKVVTFFSSDNLGEENISRLENGHHLFGIKEELVALDFNSSGVAIASTLKDVPYVSVKVVGRRLSQLENVDLYLKVLDSYINLGKGVVSTIGDIASNNVLTEGDSYGF